MTMQTILHLMTVLGFRKLRWSALHKVPGQPGTTAKSPRKKEINKTKTKIKSKKIFFLQYWG